MIINHYHAVTGEYLYSAEAREDPLTPGEYLIPASATPEPLPEVGSGQVAVFNGVLWGVVPDYRGEIIHNPEIKEQCTHNVIGELPEGFLLGELPTDFNMLRDVQKAKIDASRITAENTEFIFLHNGTNWDGGLQSRNRLDSTLDGVAVLGSLPEGFYWTDANNDKHYDITIADLQALRQAMSVQILIRGFEIHATKGALIEAIDNAPDDVAAIQAIVWPA